MNECPPNCPASSIKDEIREDIAELKSDVKELMKTNVALQSIAINVENIKSELREYKKNTQKAEDNIFERLRIIETSYVSKSDVKTFGLILSIIFTIVNIILGFIMNHSR